MNISQSQFAFEETGFEAGERIISVVEYIRTLNTRLKPVEAIVRGEVNQVTERGGGKFTLPCVTKTRMFSGNDVVFHGLLIVTASSQATKTPLYPGSD